MAPAIGGRAAPDNLIRVTLDGIGSPARPELGTMPAYHDSLNDAQVAELVFVPARAVRGRRAGMAGRRRERGQNPRGTARAMSRRGSCAGPCACPSARSHV
ncbi:hypothetical protein OKW50_005376 [Paraburkholderia youngii]